MQKFVFKPVYNEFIGVHAFYMEPLYKETRMSKYLKNVCCHKNIAQGTYRFKKYLLQEAIKN